MDPNDPTPVIDDPNIDAPGTTDADSKAAGDGNGDKPTTPTEPSKSTDPNAADGDKKPTAGESGDEGTPPKLDADLDEWIEKRGLTKPVDDEQRQKYQAFRNEQREFTRAQQAKDDSEKLNDSVKAAKDGLKPAADDDDDTSETKKRLDALEADRTAERELRLKSEFYTSEKVTTDEHKAIMEIFKEKVDKQPNDSAKLKAVDLWGSPEALPDLLDLARARILKGTDTSAVEDKAAQEERVRIAKESNAHSPSGNAKNHNPSDKTPEQERTERLKARYSDK